MHPGPRHAHGNVRAPPRPAPHCTAPTTTPGPALHSRTRAFDRARCSARSSTPGRARRTAPPPHHTLAATSLRATTPVASRCARCCLPLARLYAQARMRSLRPGHARVRLYSAPLLSSSSTPLRMRMRTLPLLIATALPVASSPSPSSRRYSAAPCLSIPAACRLPVHLSVLTRCHPLPHLRSIKGSPLHPPLHHRASRPTPSCFLPPSLPPVTTAIKTAAGATLPRYHHPR